MRREYPDRQHARGHRGDRSEPGTGQERMVEPGYVRVRVTTPVRGAGGNERTQRGDTDGDTAPVPRPT